MNKVEWLEHIKKNYPVGMAVNCKYMPQLRHSSVLRKLIKEGRLVRERWQRGVHCKRTILRLPNETV